MGVEKRVSIGKMIKHSVLLICSGITCSQGLNMGFDLSGFDPLAIEDVYQLSDDLKDPWQSD